MLITDSSELITFCEALADAPYLAVDTEFLREKTYAAQLCLVQIAHGEHAAAIDPLSPGLDLSPMHALLANPKTIKVLHAAPLRGRGRRVASGPGLPNAAQGENGVCQSN